MVSIFPTLADVILQRLRTAVTNFIVGGSSTFAIKDTTNTLAVMSIDTSGAGGGNGDALFNHNITQTAGAFFPGSSGVIMSYNDTSNISGAISLNVQYRTLWYQTLTGNITSFTIPAAQSASGQTCVVHFIQDGTGGRTLAGVAALIKFAGGTTPVLSTGANKRDIFWFQFDGTNWYELARGVNV